MKCQLSKKGNPTDDQMDFQREKIIRYFFTDDDVLVEHDSVFQIVENHPVLVIMDGERWISRSRVMDMMRYEASDHWYTIATLILHMEPFSETFHVEKRLFFSDQEKRNELRTIKRLSRVHYRFRNIKSSL